MIHFTSRAGWLPVHRDQLRAQRSVTSMGKLYLLLYDRCVVDVTRWQGWRPGAQSSARSWQQTAGQDGRGVPAGTVRKTDRGPRRILPQQTRQCASCLTAEWVATVTVATARTAVAWRVVTARNPKASIAKRVSGEHACLKRHFLLENPASSSSTSSPSSILISDSEAHKTRQTEDKSEQWQKKMLKTYINKKTQTENYLEW